MKSFDVSEGSISVSGILRISSKGRRQGNKLLAFIFSMPSVNSFPFIYRMTFSLAPSCPGAIAASKIGVNAARVQLVRNPPIKGKTNKQTKKQPKKKKKDKAFFWYSRQISNKANIDQPGTN